MAVIDYLAVSGPHNGIKDRFGVEYGRDRGMFPGLKEKSPDMLQPHPRIRGKSVYDGLSKTMLLTENTGRGEGTGMHGAVHDGKNIGSVGDDKYKDDAGVEYEVPWAINMAADIAWRMEEPFSDHPGGVNILLADGCIKFLSDATERDVVCALASRDGEEPLPPDF
jgi:prepilin-type processing-associated H-X9-DG protein